ncbi:MAG: hypothetical protein AMJ81_02880 [Phycisphaerae bacterium SM23_33]|nr:MAG: hypothetical protein AMJ81_02880 [Phycisphaerae bacterium SM23_33]
MSGPAFNKITVVGVGLLGGSVGLAVKAADERTRVVGVGRRESSLGRALASGAVDETTLETAAGVAGADLVVLATPLGAYEDHLLAMKDALPRRAVVTDVGSTKGLVVRVAESVLGRGGPFVGSHPMAGGENRGVEFARADLFLNAPCIVTPTPHTPPGHVRKVERFWKMLGGVAIRLSPSAHDRAVAKVSHLPHVLAALIVALQGRSGQGLIGSGFLDTTRVASGNAAMWREILMTNRKAVLAAVDAADEQLMRLRDLLEVGDGPGIERFLAQAKRRRDEWAASRLRRAE